jgi:chromosome segregation protein
MYIKQIEITGFKSFADRIKLQFSPGINSIVGPNGCGKSNVIDAIRWVMGEQKYSLLRSKAMDEVIFVGTSSRKPAGLSQVSLTFDNSDGILPMEFSEVTLTRRIFRDSGGQYLVNNKNVRLKDVNELLADTGIGSGAFYILSNQEIERVLSPNSQDRRSILEETAGINKYQIRKKETLQKLSAVKENITRLNDILQEVSRQQETCQIQAKKLEKYKKAKEKLSRLEATLLKFDLSELSEKVEELNSRISAAKKEKKSLDVELDKKSNEEVALLNRYNQCKVENEGVREAFQKIGIEEEKLKGNSNLFQEKIRQGEETLKEYESNLQLIEHRIETIQKGIDENLLALQKIQEEKDEITGLYDEVLQECNIKDKDYEEVKKQIDELSISLSGLLEEQKILKVKKEHSASSLDSLQKEKDRKHQQLEKMLADIKAADGSISTCRNELESLKQKKEQVEKERGELDSSRVGILKSYQEYTRRVRKLKEEIREARSEVAMLTREEESYRGFSAAFQAIMERRDTLPPLVPVHTIIRVSPEYETAADVVLGAHFQSIITQNRHDADLCIELLKRERLGRLTFFPMDLERKSIDNRDISRKLPGIVGWAKDLINTEVQYRDIVEIICGKTLIVTDLDSAYEIYRHQKRNRDFVPKMVSLDGDVLEFSGAVTGGRHKTDRSQLLSRTRRREELEQGMISKIKLLEKLETELKSLDEKLANQDKQWKEFQKNFDLVDKEYRDLSGQLKLFQSMNERGAEDLRTLRETSKELEAKIKAEELNLLEIDERECLIVSEIAEKENAIKAIREKNIDKVDEMGTVRSRRDELKKNLDELESRMRMINSRIEGDRAYLEDSLKDRNRVNELLSNKKIEIETNKNQLQDFSNQSSIISLKLKSMKIALESSRKSLEESEQALDSCKKMQADLDNQQRAIDERINRYKIDNIELDSKIAYAKDRLKEYSDEIIAQANLKVGETRENIQENIEKNRKNLQTFETVNFSADEEYERTKERYDTLKSQIDDLSDASNGLRKIIREMDSASLQALEETLENLNIRFGELFKKVFNGGMGRIFFSDPSNKLESGIEVEVQPPGKRTSNMNLLSTGEKSLTAVTFLFALLSIKPGPFVLLDELDAPLDENNVEKIATLVREFSDKSQFIVITHNKKTMEYADALIGITMEEPGVSKVVSVKFDDVDKFAEKSMLLTK